MTQRLWSVLNVDIRKYFDTISHCHLRAFLHQRVTDGVIQQMIDKWLAAGVLEDGHLHRPTEGTPQVGSSHPVSRTSSCTMCWMGGTRARCGHACGRQHAGQVRRRPGDGVRDIARCRTGVGGPGEAA